MAPCVCRACPSTDQTCPARVLFLAHPGGVAEQFGHGNGDPLGVPSTWGGMQPASLPAACGSTVTFGGARLNWGGGLVCFCYPRPCCHPAPPTRGEGDMWGAQLCRAHTALQGSCSGGIWSPTLSMGGSASPARRVMAERWTRGASRAWMGLGA